MKKVRSKEKLTLNSETIRHLKDLTERELRHVQGGSIDTHTGFWWCTSTQNVDGG